MAWKRVHLDGDQKIVLIMGLAGTIPAATTNEAADFYLTVPLGMTLENLKAVAKTAPGVTTTLQIRRSTNGGTSFSNAFGTVSLSSVRTGTASPADLAVSEGDVLNFSVTVGDGSGADLLIEVVGKVD